MAVSDGKQVRQAPWDASTFESLYRRTSGAVYRYVYFRTGMNGDIAAEITGDVFLAAWRAEMPARERGLPWLYGIAARKVADFHRKSGREITFSKVEADDRRRFEHLLGFEARPGDGEEQTDAVRRVLGQALTSLPLETQTLLLDKYVHRIPVRSMAGQLRKTESATMSLLARARRRLREAVLSLLEKEG